MTPPAPVLLKGVLHEGRPCDILLADGRIKSIAPAGAVSDPSAVAACVLDCASLAILPAFYNTHTHAAMTLLRGYADDMPLMKWLQDYIWPYEDRLTAADIRRGSALATEEMTSGGTVFFNDMYFEVEQTIETVAASGMRAAIGITVMDNHSLAQTEDKKRFVREFKDPTGGRIQLVIAPHAIYTVGKDRLKEWAAFARDNGLRLHIHLSEPAGEVSDCLSRTGLTPVQYLDSIGFLGPDVIAAHCVHLTREDADTLARRGVTVSHCPCSNMKLGSGIFPFALLQKAGCRITLGTDGASSGNNLDMREAMKFSALLAKVGGELESASAPEVLRSATECGARAFGIDGGVIAEGKVADCVLVDLNNVRMRPLHSRVSNWVYSADSCCIRAVFCDGRPVFERSAPLF